VQDLPAWVEAVEHVHASADCADVDATYVLLDAGQWMRRGYLPQWAGFITADNEAYVRADGFGPYSTEFLLRHEFVHILLRCAGVPEAVHKAHDGAVWDGLRAGDPGDR